jgi:hypothetical protein
MTPLPPDPAPIEAPDSGFEPPRLPIPLADPKPWYRSLTIKSSLGQVAAGLVLALVAYLVPMPADLSAALSAYALGQMSLGAAAVIGRYRAEQPIGG